MNRFSWDERLRKHHSLRDKIFPFVRPLFETFECVHFCYFFVDSHGQTACLSSNSDWIEFYLQQNLFLNSPFLRSPKLIPEAAYFTKEIKDKRLEQSRRHAKNFGIEETLVLTHKKGEILHAFCFGFPQHVTGNSLLINELPLLQRYCSEFERKAQKQIAALEPVDIKSFIGERFEKSTLSAGLDLSKRKNFLTFFNSPYPDLSKREKQCLLLSMQGMSAQGIGLQLALSRRTVESYLDHLKCKLNCTSKSELIQKANELKDLRLL